MPEFIAMDDWRVTSGITISAGLRYEAQSNLHDWSDAGPRLGIAWAPGASGSGTPKTVFRAGAGFVYQRVGSNFFLNQARFNGINQQQIVVENPTFFPTVPPIATLEAAQQPLTTDRLDPHDRAPRGFITALTVERQLPGKTTVSATGSTSWGRALSRASTSTLRNRELIIPLSPPVACDLSGWPRVTCLSTSPRA